MEVELKAGNIISVGGKSYKIKDESADDSGTNYVSPDGIETFGDALPVAIMFLFDFAITNTMLTTALR